MNYTYEPISALAISGMTVSGLISLAAPIVLFFLWRKKTGAKLSSFILGCVTFFMWALILESFFHKVVFSLTGTAITGNLLYYSLYGGLAAGLFEEFGRHFAMKAGMKGNLKTLNKENAIMFGIGHGGIETILVCVVSEISNVATSIAINRGGITEVLDKVADGAAKDALYQQISVLWTYNGGIFFAAGIERLSAMAFHIGASYLVYKAVADKKAGYFFLAVFLHAILDAGTMLLNGSGCPIWALEAVVAAFSAIFLVLVIKDYKKREDVTELAETKVETEEKAEA